MTPVGYIHEDQYCAVCNGSQDPSPTSFHKKQAACRYYQAGNCRRGHSCPFEHSSVADRVETPTLPHPAYQAEHMFAYHPPGQTPVYRPPGPQTHPVFLWQPYLPPSHPFDPRYRLASQAEAVSDYPDDKSDPSSAESSSTAASMDYQLRMVLDTARSEGAELRVVRSIASPSGDFGINSSPGYGCYRYPVFPAVKDTYVVGRGRATSRQCLDQGSMVTLPSPFSLSRQDDMKKPLAYKTKPCKFYTANGKCSNGEKCTFIHDPESKGNANKSSTELTPLTDAKLPPKPLNKYEECRANDFYPIAWRVIGGGVMMGGQRQICPAFAAGNCKNGNDCRLAHETELQTDQVGFIELQSETLRNAEGLPHYSVKGTSPKRLQGRKFTRVPSPETQRENFPSTTPRLQRLDVPALEGIESTEKRGNEVVAPPTRDAPTSPVHRRTQSMSMVHTSPLPLDTTHTNYAAEL